MKISALTSMFLLLISIIISASAKADLSQFPNGLTSEQVTCAGERLSLGCENVGVYLDRYYSTYPEEYRWLQALRLTNNRHASKIKSLQALIGLIQIKSGNAALSYARLLTSPMTWNLMKGEGAGEMEIVTPQQAINLPTYGLKHNDVSMDPDANFDASDLHLPPGLAGVIPSKAFDKGGFTPPHVEIVPEGFAIIRWIFTNLYPNGNREAFAKKIREVVTTDGVYSRTVLLGTLKNIFIPKIWDNLLSHVGVLP